MPSFRRLVAAALSATLVLTAPGLPAYAAVGRATTEAGAGRALTLAAPTPNLAAPLGAATLPAPPASLGATTLPALPSAAAAAASGDFRSRAVISLSPAAAAAKAAAPSASAAGARAAAPRAADISANGGNPTVSKPAVPAATALGAAQGVSREVSRGAAPAALNAAFDGSLTRAASADGVTASAAASAGMAPLSPASAGSSHDGGSVPPAAPGDKGNGDGPQGPRKPALWKVLALGAIGGTVGWFAAPFAAAWLAAHVPALALVAAHAAAAKAVVVCAGVLVGFAASQGALWAGYPRALLDPSARAASGTFRFWARFGLVFDSVMRGKAADAAMKAPLTPNLFAYPLLAWPFVLVGYAGAPVGLAFGFLYKALDVPVRAALRGLKQAAVEIFPWLVDVARAIRRALAHALPFLGGAFWGLVRGEAAAVAAGAYTLASPIFKNVVVVDYAAESLPGWVAARLVQLSGLIFGVTAGAMGVAVGLVVGLPFAFTESARLALEKGGADGPATRALQDWGRKVSSLGGPDFLAELPFKRGAIEPGQGLTRLLNLRLASFFLTPVLAVSAASLYIRAWSAPAAQRPDRVVVEISERSGAAPKPEGGALRRYGSEIARGANETAQTSWSVWRQVAAVTESSIYGRSVPVGQTGLIGSPAYLFGGAATAIGFVGGGLYEGLLVPGAALWRGAARLAEKAWPAIRGVLSFLVRVVKRVVPFAFGFVVGTIGGLWDAGMAGGKAFFAPFAEIFDYAGGLSDDEHSAISVQASMLALALPALVSSLAGFAAGLVAGVPYALTSGAAKAVSWARTGKGSEKWARSWSELGADEALEQLEPLTGRAGFDAAGGKTPAARALVAGLNALVAAPVTALSLIGASWFSAWPTALSLTARSARGEELPKAAPADQPRAPQAPEEPSVPWKAPPAWVPALLGLSAVGVAAFAPAYLAVFGGLLGWKLWLASGAALALAAGAGLAVSQPSFWGRLPGRVSDGGAAGAQSAWRVWSRLGDGFAAALLARRADGSPLGWLHRALGALLVAPSAVLGAAHAVFWLGARAAFEGARQVVEGLLPFLKSVWSLAVRVAKRLFPFVGGLIAGAAMGVVGSATFGALLLGRPYFKHVVAPPIEEGPFAHKLGVAALKTVAAVAGVAFGLVGLVVGVLGALPYALTLPVATAFSFAGVGGKTQTFFELWSRGSLRAELRRLNQLTDRFEFPQTAAGRLALSDGWLRLANVVPATFAAAVAATVAGYVAYGRSLLAAWRDARAGKTAPAEGFDDMSRVGKTVKTGSKVGRASGKWLGGWGTLLVMGYLAIKAGSLSGVGSAILYAGLGSLGGWLAGLVVGAALGFGVGLILWLADQLD